MFLPSDSDVNEMDERAGVINGVAKALDKRMDKQAQQQKGDREQLRKEITAVSDDVMGLSKEMNEKLAAIEKSLAALEHGVASSTAGIEEERKLSSKLLHVAEQQEKTAA